MHISESNLKFGPRPSSTPRTIDFISELHKFLMNGREAMKKLKLKNDKRSKRERHKSQPDIPSVENPFLIASEPHNLNRHNQAKVSPTRPSETLRTQLRQLTSIPCPKMEVTFKRNSTDIKSFTTKPACDKVCPTCLRRIPHHVAGKHHHGAARYNHAAKKSYPIAQRPNSVTIKTSPKAPKAKACDKKQPEKFAIEPTTKDEPVQVTVSRGKRNSKLAVNLKIEPQNSANMPFVTISQIRPTRSNQSGCSADTKEEDLGLMICIHDPKKSDIMEKLYADKMFNRLKPSKKVVSNSKLSYRRIGMVCSFSKSDDPEKPYEHRIKKTIITEKQECGNGGQCVSKSVPTTDKLSNELKTTSKSSPQLTTANLVKKPISKENGHANLYVHFDRANKVCDQACQTQIVTIKDHTKPRDILKEPKSSSDLGNLNAILDRKSRRDVLPNRVLAAKLKAIKLKTSKSFQNPFYEPIIPIKLTA